MNERIAARRPAVHGLEMDPQTRCVHYHSERDIIAIRMKCCDTYYACKDCHEALADHAIETWSREEWDERAVLCGACRAEMSIQTYLGCANLCPFCGAAFNPGCRGHYHFYFDCAAA